MLLRVWCWITDHRWLRYEYRWEEGGKEKTRRYFRCERCLKDRFDLLIR